MNAQDEPRVRSDPTHRLVLLRHAKSSWADEGSADVDRPLAERGRRDAGAVGRWLVDHDHVPELVLCSTATRTRQTWARAAAGGGDRLAAVPVRHVDAIYQAWPDTLLDLVRSLPEDVGTALLVGHAPGVPELADRLQRVSGDQPLGASADGFPTSALAVLEVRGPWAGTGPGTARLLAYEVVRG